MKLPFRTKDSYKQRRIKFLNDMIQYYSEDVLRRSKSEDGDWCCYLAYNGNKCAIGRWIPKEKYISSVERNGVNAFVLSILPKEIANLDKCFLQDVQFLHDGNHNWSNEGLSEQGKSEIDVIKRKIKANVYINGK